MDSIQNASERLSGSLSLETWTASDTSLSIRALYTAVQYITEYGTEDQVSHTLQHLASVCQLLECLRALGEAIWMGSSTTALMAYRSRYPAIVDQVTQYIDEVKHQGAPTLARNLASADAARASRFRELDTQIELVRSNDIAFAHLANIQQVCEYLERHFDGRIAKIAGYHTWQAVTILRDDIRLSSCL